MESVQELARTITSALEALHGQEKNWNSDIHGFYKRLAANLDQLPEGVQCVHCARSVAWPQLEPTKPGERQVGACICMSQSYPSLWKLCDDPTGEGATQKDRHDADSDDAFARCENLSNHSGRADLLTAEKLDPVAGDFRLPQVPCRTPAQALNAPSRFGNTVWTHANAFYPNVGFQTPPTRIQGPPPSGYAMGFPYMSGNAQDSVGPKRARNTTAARETRARRLEELDPHEHTTFFEQSKVSRDTDHDHETSTSPLHEQGQVTTIHPKDTTSTLGPSESDDKGTRRGRQRNSHLNRDAVERSHKMRKVNFTTLDGQRIPPPPSTPPKQAPSGMDSWAAGSSQPLTSATYIPRGQGFGPGVGIPSLGETYETNSTGEKHIEQSKQQQWSHPHANQQYPTMSTLRRDPKQPQSEEQRQASHQTYACKRRIPRMSFHSRPTISQPPIPGAKRPRPNSSLSNLPVPSPPDTRSENDETSSPVDPFDILMAAPSSNMGPPAAKVSQFPNSLKSPAQPQLPPAREHVKPEMMNSEASPLQQPSAERSIGIQPVSEQLSTPKPATTVTSMGIQHYYGLENVQQRQQQQQQQHMGTLFGDSANLLNDESLDLDMDFADIGAERGDALDSIDFDSFLDPNDGDMALDFSFGVDVEANGGATNSTENQPSQTPFDTFIGVSGAETLRHTGGLHRGLGSDNLSRPRSNSDTTPLRHVAELGHLTRYALSDCGKTNHTAINKIESHRRFHRVRKRSVSEAFLGITEHAQISPHSKPRVGSHASIDGEQCEAPVQSGWDSSDNENNTVWPYSSLAVQALLKRWVDASAAAVLLEPS